MNRDDELIEEMVGYVSGTKDDDALREALSKEGETKEVPEVEVYPEYLGMEIGESKTKQETQFGNKEQNEEQAGLDSKVKQKIEKLSQNVEQLRAEIAKISNNNDSSLSPVIVEKMIENAIDKHIKDVAFIDGKSDKVATETERDEEIYYSKPNDVVEDEPIEEIYKFENEDLKEEVEVEVEVYPTSTTNVDVEDTVDKKSSIKKFLTLSLVFIGLIIFALYGYGKYRQSMHESQKELEISGLAINPNPIIEKQKILSPAKPVTSTIDESKIQNTVNESIKKVIVSKPTVSKEQDYDAKHKSPIEKELMGDTRKKDIAFVCRLATKYPSGNYVYFIKQNGKYVENKAQKAFSITERNIIYNYSPDNKFVKLEDGKYIKTKLFANCIPVK